MTAKEEAQFLGEYQTELRRSEWERMAEQLLNAGVTHFLYLLRPDKIYRNLRVSLATCGMQSKEDFRNKRILIVGGAPGLEVRIARDIGLDAISVDLESELVELSHNLRITSSAELIDGDAQGYLYASPNSSFDMVLGMNQLIVDEDEVNSLYLSAFKPLKPSGTLLLWGDMHNQVSRPLSNFPVDHPVIMDCDTLRAIKRE